MAEQRAIELEHPDGSTEGLLVTPVGPNLFRLEESSLLGEAFFGDVIEADAEPNGRMRFKRVATPSGMTSVTFIVPKKQSETPEFEAILSRVISAGGHWERVFGGVLFVHLPPSADLNVAREIKALLG